MKKLLIGFIIGLTSFAIILFTVPPLRSQIMETVGLAVAQSNIIWNNLKDSNVGDNLTSGTGAMGMYYFDGTNMDRVRGTGGAMNVSMGGTATPAEGYANPTTASISWTLLGLFNGSTWDRALSSSHGDGITAARGINSASFGYLFGGATWDRMLSSTHADNLTTARGANVAGFNYGFDGTNWDRLLTSTHGDAITTATGLNAASYAYLFNGTTYDRLRGLSGAANVSTAVSSTITTNQITVDTTVGGVLIRAINTSRRSIIIRNQGQTDMYVGASGLTALTGLLVKASENITLDRSTAAIYGITAAGSTTTGYLEE